MKRRFKMLCCVLLALSLPLVPGRTSKAAEDGFVSYESTATTLKKGAFDPDVTFNTYKKNILVGDNHTLSIDKYDDKDYKFTFKSSDSSVLSVKQTSATSCKYTGTGYGTAKIIVKVTDDSGFFGFLFDKSATLSLKVSVTPHAVSVKFKHATRTVAVNHKIKLSTTIRPSISEETPTFESSAPKIAHVSKKGRVTGKKEGVAYITATLDNGKSARCKVLVREKSSDNLDDPNVDENEDE